MSSLSYKFEGEGGKKTFINHSCLDAPCRNSVGFFTVHKQSLDGRPFCSSFRAAYRGVLSSPVKTVRDALINQCAQILACYRKNCASPSSAGQVNSSAFTRVTGSGMKRW